MIVVNFSCAKQIKEADLPNEAGCYILLVDLKGIQHLQFPSKSGLSVLYVGKAENSIQGRVLKTHLVSNRSGSSTLRRSLGAMLHKQLNLTPLPRSSKNDDKKRFTNYKFDSEGEITLTKWIKTHVYVIAVPSKTPKASEDQLIAELSPPLNLTKWPNPYGKMIKDQRKMCAESAKILGVMQLI